tara:strand:+ start:18066 stop:18326 length:261 start_codon:yes stop_codon:yes gene_type:complete
MYEFEILIVLNLITLIALYINAAVIGKALEMVSEMHDVLAHLLTHAVLVEALEDGEFELLEELTQDAVAKINTKKDSTLFEDMESE